MIFYGMVVSIFYNTNIKDKIMKIKNIFLLFFLSFISWQSLSAEPSGHTDETLPMMMHSCPMMKLCHLPMLCLKALFGKVTQAAEEAIPHKKICQCPMAKQLIKKAMQAEEGAPQHKCPMIMKILKMKLQPKNNDGAEEG